MTLYFKDNLITIYNGDARDMSELAGNSIQCVVTSPPYWGLRKYAGLPDLIWGGDEKCKHRWDSYDATLLHENRQGLDGSSIGNTERRRGKHGFNAGRAGFCSLCGAWKGQYGLEPTPELYIEHTIQILREIRRVLRKDGVVFWNVGDSYYGGRGGGWKGDEHNQQLKTFKKKGFSIKPKDLCLIPFRVAIAAQEDGWWVRSVIIWSKPNSMPESVTDRPTESHEYILMLTKNKNYYWDAEAVREKAHPETWGVGGDGSYSRQGTKDYALAGVQSPSDIKRRIGAKTRGMKTKGEVELFVQEQHHGQDIFDNPLGRNIRSVWEFPTQPYPEAHFAVFPEKLPEICIKAATPEVGCCSKCGKPWERILKRLNKSTYQQIKDDTGFDYHDSLRFTKARGVALSSGNESGGNTLTPEGKVPWYDKPEYQTLGWQPACKCNANKVPSIVLDPFTGTGTTLWMAKKLNRRAIGYELSEEYCRLALERNRQKTMGI